MTFHSSPLFFLELIPIKHMVPHNSTQTAFVKVTHYLQVTQTPRNFSVLFLFDLSVEFESVAWSHLLKIISPLGFQRYPHPPGFSLTAQAVSSSLLLIDSSLF